jgi:hypothetical protein
MALATACSTAMHLSRNGAARQKRDRYRNRGPGFARSYCFAAPVSARMVNESRKIYRNSDTFRAFCPSAKRLRHNGRVRD